MKHSNEDVDISRSPVRRFDASAIVLAAVLGGFVIGCGREGDVAVRGAEFKHDASPAHVGSGADAQVAERAAQATTAPTPESPSLPGEGTGSLALKWVGMEVSRWQPDTTLISSIEAEDPALGRRLRARGRNALTVPRLSTTTGGVPCVDHWLPDLPAGRYRVELSPLGVRRSITVEPGRTAEVSFEVPPLAQTTIVFLDAATGAPRVPEQAWVSVKGASGVPVWSKPVGPAKGGEMVFVSEPGQLHVNCKDPSFALGEVTTDHVVAGVNVITALLVPSAHLILEWDATARGADQELMDSIQLEGPNGRGAQLGTEFPVREGSTLREVVYTIPADTAVKVRIVASGSCASELFEVRVAHHETERRRIGCR